MDEQQFSEAVRQYQKLLFHIAYSMLHNQQDCADAVQQALLNAWRMQGKLRNEQAIKAWLSRILINECHAVLRRKKRVEFTALSDDWPAPLQVDNLPLHNALERLSPQTRVPIVLHYLEGFDVKEIAQTLHIPVGTVKSRMAHGRKQLGEMLHDEWKEQ